MPPVQCVACPGGSLHGSARTLRHRRVGSGGCRASTFSSRSNPATPSWRSAASRTARRGGSCRCRRRRKAATRKGVRDWRGTYQGGPARQRGQRKRHVRRRNKTGSPLHHLRFAAGKAVAGPKCWEVTLTGESSIAPRSSVAPAVRRSVALRLRAGQTTVVAGRRTHFEYRRGSGFRRTQALECRLAHLRSAAPARSAKDRI